MFFALGAGALAVLSLLAYLIWSGYDEAIQAAGTTTRNYAAIIEARLDALRAQPQAYDVVVTDLSMPHMSGIDFRREVLAVRPDMPVLMTTGNIGSEDEGKARAAGVRELILKPVAIEELGRALERKIRPNESNGKPSA